MNLIIRRAGCEDIPALCRLEAICFSQPWSAAAFEDFFAGDCSLALAAEVDGRFAGYVTLHLIAGEGEIANLAVDPAFRRCGVGSALMRHLESDPGPDRLLLDVRESNTAARALYESLGFTVDGIRKRFYSRPSEDGILMSKTITKKEIPC